MNMIPFFPARAVSFWNYARIVWSSWGKNSVPLGLYLKPQRRRADNPEFCVFSVRITCVWSWRGEQSSENAILESCLFPSCM